MRQGEINGVIGVIPTNYVEMPKDLAAAMSLANNVSTPSSSTSTVSLSQAFTPPVASPPQKQGHFGNGFFVQIMLKLFFLKKSPSLV